jgi:hypothetical protein
MYTHYLKVIALFHVENIISYFITLIKAGRRASTATQANKI